MISSSAFHILLALADGERHGYAITREVADETEGAVKLGPGTLYRMLKQLLDDEWIVEVDRTDADDPRRRYYKLTARGRRIAQAEALRLANVVRLARVRRLLPAGA
jgi:DNA-binding PadR family transcriptional regulator